MKWRVREEQEKIIPTTTSQVFCIIFYPSNQPHVIKDIWSHSGTYTSRPFPLFLLSVKLIIQKQGWILKIVLCLLKTVLQWKSNASDQNFRIKTLLRAHKKRDRHRKKKHTCQSITIEQANWTWFPHILLLVTIKVRTIVTQLGNAEKTLKPRFLDMQTLYIPKGNVREVFLIFKATAKDTLCTRLT